MAKAQPTRRSFLSAIAALPFMGQLAKLAAPAAAPPIGVPIQALIPLGDELLIVGCDHSAGVITAAGHYKALLQSKRQDAMNAMCERLESQMWGANA